MKKNINFPPEILEESEVLARQLTYNIKNSDKSKAVTAVKKALIYCRKHREEYMPVTDSNYYNHAVEIAKIIASFYLDIECIIAGLIYYCLGNLELDFREIGKSFGDEVAATVQELIELNNMPATSSTRQQQNIYQNIIAEGSDIRITMIQLAERVHHMRIIHNITSLKQKSFSALEALEVYAPLAAAMGMQTIKNELCERSFSILFPKEKERISAYLNERVDDSFISQTVHDLRILVKEKLKIDAEIYGRKKSPYSVWTKINRKKRKLEQLPDIIAFRIIVPDTQDCYSILSLLHKTYKFKADKVKDFIGSPKKNGYRSLHTLIALSGQQIEIQIRTKKMHYIAEHGLAAHWSYKQSYYNSAPNKKGLLRRINNRKYTWTQKFMVTSRARNNKKESLKSIGALGHYWIHCFTEKGNKITLLQNSTVADFAHAIDTEVVNHLIGAIVNDEFVTADAVLHNNDVVRILTDKEQFTKKQWEKLAVTEQAQMQIKKLLENRKNERFIAIGRRVICKALGINKKSSLGNILLKICRKSRQPTIEKLLYEINAGNIRRRNVLAWLPGMRKFISFFLLLLDKIKVAYHKKNLKGAGDESIELSEKSNSAVYSTTSLSTFSFIVYIKNYSESMEYMAHEVYKMYTNILGLEIQAAVENSLKVKISGQFTDIEQAKILAGKVSELECVISVEKVFQEEKQQASKLQHAQVN